MLKPPIAPMLAKLSTSLPEGEGWLYEPKWDGFRALVFRDGSEVYLQSRDLKPFNRYFPELLEPLAQQVPQRCVLDGEDLIAAPQEKRRALLEKVLSRAMPPVYLTPATRDPAVAQDWFSRFEGAGLDGVVAKRLDDVYQPDKRVMFKVKHARTADCVVAGFRWHKNGPGTMVGSLLLGLYDDAGTLHHVGVTSSFTTAARKQLVKELEPLRAGAVESHPWREWAQFSGEQRMPGATSRWNRGKDLSWEPLRIERVCEVAYDHLQGDRFRHATTFKRWRPDKPPSECRYDQLEETPAAELKQIFGARQVR